MHSDTAAELLENAGIRPTSNRVLVLRTITVEKRPLSLREIEEKLQTLEKSSIFRVLSLLAEKHVLHTVEDGDGTARYELCNAGHLSLQEDIHAHFYCTKCRKVYCFDSIHMPDVSLPDGFLVSSMNYMFKGICPDCAGKNNDPV